MSAQEEAQRQMHEQFSQHVVKYNINLDFPAEVISSTTKPLRTNPDLIQHRLLECGLAFDETRTVAQVTETSNVFVENLTKTGCFETVHVKLDQGAAAGQETQDTKDKLQVILKESNWYRIYIGAGIKQDGMMQQGQDTLIPKAQFETTASLINLSGNFDKTQIQYTVDQTSSATLGFQHERPLFSFFKPQSPAYTNLLSMEDGSQFSLATKALLDTLDYEWTRSYKEYQRSIGFRLATLGNIPAPEVPSQEYEGLEWTFVFRDIVPKRNPILPYTMDASPEVVSQSGPDTKHSLKLELRSNGTLTNDKFNPTSGFDWHTVLELAGPPGDVGFFKCHAGSAAHMPLGGGLSVHASLSGGYIHPLSFGGLCGGPGISDRFYLGGPMSLRGFAPGGIGPRAKTGVASGDALGGNLYWKGGVYASIPIEPLQAYGNIRLFGFANAGTLMASTTALESLVKSTRVSAGGGISGAVPGMGRVELTYGIPLRYGPRDVQKSLQFGFGFTFG